MGQNVIQAHKIKVKKGKVVDKFQFSVSGTPIPTISEKPVKKQGKFPDSIKNT